jgi:hypothetical protein
MGETAGEGTRMKMGRNLQDVVQAIIAQKEHARDFLAPARALEMVVVDDAPLLTLQGEGYPLKALAHRQLAEHVGIPQKYYDRMRDDDPGLLARNVNTWLARSDETRLVRTWGTDGGIRAYLSDKFRPLDNYDLAEAILPEIVGRNWDIRSCEVTDTRLYLKIVSQDIRAEIRPGHVNVRDGGQTHIVHPGLTITNSEVGLGALSVEPSCHWQHCLNLAALGATVRRTHTGKRLTGETVDGSLIEAYISDATRQLETAAVFARVKDVVHATLTEQVFRRMIAQVAASTEDRLLASQADEVVEVLAQRYDLTEPTRKRVLDHLFEAGDLSRYGVSGAVTRASQDEADYDDASRLERVGGLVIEMHAHEWRQLVGA